MVLRRALSFRAIECLPGSTRSDTSPNYPQKIFELKEISVASPDPSRLDASGRALRPHDTIVT